MTKIQQEMQELADSGIDALLMATMILDDYENTVFGSSQQSHHDTAIALLRVQQQTKGSRNLPIERAVRRSIIKTCILHGAGIPAFLKDGTVYEEDISMLELDSLLVGAACLREKSVNLPLDGNSENTSGHTKLTDLATEAEVLENALAAWPVVDRADWKFVRLPVSTSLESTQLFPLYGDSVHRYQSHGHATIWNMHRAVRARVNSIRIQCVSRLLLQGALSHSASVSEQLAVCRQTLDSSVRDLGESIPFFSQFSISTRKGFEELTTGRRLILSDSKIVPKMAALLAWALAMLFRIDAVEGSQKQWLKLVLKTVADSLQKLH
ncbi:hypothetical protein A1O1_06997 [Capronia coronata CBS 617.96]|uniref:Transcription factor domain-containing protein n=1 Tax=Capronia coronata CBS 617.96 TaxID=1182541 RepID=W9Y192_9EURO|nr:uncharacterized protein A1O1_06997 [Capronia coronata CBS 617.96]EXJ83375.1 hypothetical protein A1O1_06997 [Capronia coronata CBS 617.96]